MTNFNNLGTCTLLDGSCYAQDVKDYVIPFVNQHFNVSANPDQRAFAGRSVRAAASVPGAACFGLDSNRVIVDTRVEV